MQTRTITVDYARPRGYDVGYRAENNFTLLALPIPAELEGADSYRVYFESTVGEYLQTELLTPADGYVTVKITSDIVPEPGNMAAQLVAFADGEIVGYAPMITGSAKVSIPDGTERLSHSLAAEIALNTAARHTHENKAVLDKFAESDGKPTYNGEALGGGTSDFIIKMTVEGDDDGNYTVISCDATVEQIDAAVAAEKRVALIVSVGGTIIELPMVQGVKGDSYYFSTFLSGQETASFVQKVGGNTSEWQLLVSQIEAGAISYSNAALPSVTNVGGALDELVPKSHTHANKDTLDKLSDSNGKLQYNGSDVGLKGDKGDKGDPGSDANVTKANVITALGYTPEAVSSQVTTGSNITLADNTEYRLTDVTTLTLTYPTSDFECWMRLNFAASGDITVTLPAGTEYLGATPNFKNGETWELSFKDKVLAAKKVGGDDKDADGVTPHIGENGNWYIGNTDTGKPSRGADGKSAYQYAQEGGYTGTEAEFAEKLASGALIVAITDNNGTLSADKTFTEIRDAILAGIPVLVDYDGAGLPLISMGDSLFFGAIQCDETSVGTIIIEITQYGEVNDISAFVEALPNPNAITFTGAVTGSYDGSSPMSVNIPSAVTDDHINSLIDTKLGVIENGSY